MLKSIAVILLASSAGEMSNIQVDTDRLKQELDSGASVLQSLRKNGDNNAIVHVRFVGDVKNIKDLTEQLPKFGWRVIQIVPEAGQSALDMRREVPLGRTC
jgi:hypothetical protein